MFLLYKLTWLYFFFSKTNKRGALTNAWTFTYTCISLQLLSKSCWLECLQKVKMDWLQGILVTRYDRIGHVKHDSSVRESIRWQCLDELYRWEYLRSTSSGWLNRQPMFCHNWITIQFCITIEEFHFLFEVRTLGLINQIVFISSRTVVGLIQLSSNVYLFLKLGLTSLFFASNLCHFLFMSIIYFWWNISRYNGTTWYPASVISVLPLKLWDVTYFPSSDISNPRYQR